MEITHRPDRDIGKNLWCPVRRLWSDALASQVKPGDRVLHWKAWQADAMPALVGWSESTGPPSKKLLYYEYDEPKILCWRVPLGGPRRFKRPITSDSLLPLLDQLMDTRDQLEDTYGKPVYFPFIRYRRAELRARQGYLTKFPAELFDLIPGIRSARL
jgi:hypothetical protein